MDVMSLASNHLSQAISIRRQIHQNPELSYQEFATTALIKEVLKKNGISIEPLSSETGVSALIQGKRGDKTITLREDIDALPMQEQTGLPYASKNSGVCHSCGHDLHTACLLLTGMVLNECRDKLNCNVRLVFQPAEEVMTGAETLFQKGLGELLPESDMVVGVHTSPDYPAGSIALIKGAANASSDQIEIKVKGIGGHGAHPYRAVDPIVTAGILITQLQTIVSRENVPFDPAILSFGTIHGGTAPNIIPDEVVLTGTLRTFREAHRQQMLDSIKRIAKHCCEAMRAKAEVKVICGIPVLVNDSGIVDDLALAAKETIGLEHVFYPERPSPGSDDFAVFLKKMPGVQFLIGTANENPDSRIGLHNPKNLFDEAGIYTGAVVMSQFVLNQK